MSVPRLGAHFPFAMGLAGALQCAARTGASAASVFVANPIAPFRPPDAAAVDAWHAARRHFDGVLLAHAAYVQNLGAASAHGRAQAIRRVECGGGTARATIGELNRDGDRAGSVWPSSAWRSGSALLRTSCIRAPRRVARARTSAKHTPPTRCTKVRVGERECRVDTRLWPRGRETLAESRSAGG